jgi:hypothetical protein
VNPSTHVSTILPEQENTNHKTIETLVLSPLYTFEKGVFDVFYSGREGVTRVEQLIVLIG